MQKSNGKIVGSLVLSMIFIVLLPVWVFGNLFVVAFPAKRLKVLTAASIPIVSNTSADARDRDVVSSQGVANVEVILDNSELAKHGDGVKGSSPVIGEELVPALDTMNPDQAPKPNEAPKHQEWVVLEEATRVEAAMSGEELARVLFGSEPKTMLAPIASTIIAEAASTPVIQTVEYSRVSEKLQGSDEQARSPLVAAEVSAQTTEGLVHNQTRRSPEMRIWKNPAGKEVEGTLVRVMGDRIEFRTKAGKVVTSAVAYFSEADQAYIKTFEHLK